MYVCHTIRGGVGVINASLLLNAVKEGGLLWMVYHDANISCFDVKESSENMT